MARAYGSSAHLLMKRETVYGQAATSDFIRMPFNRCNLGSEQGLIDDPVLGQGRDPLAPLQDVINDEGDIVVPVDPRYLGLWLTGLFGDPATTDNLDGSWDHVFASGNDALPSYTIEVGMPKVPAFFVHAGVKLNSIALEFTRSGPAAATVNAIAQGETRFGATQGGTPTSLTFSRISQFQGSIKRAGSPVGNLTAGSVTYSNNLEKIETIRDDGLIEGADPTIAALTGRIDARFRALCRWHFQPGGGPEYCRACRDDGLACARGEPGADRRLCPCREHGLISRQEHETWDALLACQGQLRLAPSGHVVGIDMHAALERAAACSCDVAALSELLPAAEAGLVEALHADTQSSEGAASERAP